MVLQFTRNQYFMVGLLLLLIGAQFRLIDSVVLTEKSARFVVFPRHFVIRTSTRR